MALIDKETIRAEIERYEAGAQSAYNPHDEYADFYYGKVIACEDLLDLLDTLPEQPVVKKSNALFEECLANVDPAIRKEVSDNIDKMLRRQPVEGLEEEMEKFFETMPVLEHENIFEDTFQNIARHFAEWGAEHLKK